MALNKIFGIKPEDNTCSDLVPMSYFYNILNNILEINKLIAQEKYEDGRQPLLVHLDILLTLAKKYPNVAAMGISKLNRKELKETFELWWNRNEKKIPARFRSGIRQNADDLFNELFAIKSWEKSQ